MQIYVAVYTTNTILTIHLIIAILTNSTLFILFGFDDKQMLTSDTHFLSVTGSSNSQIGWLKTFQLIEPTKPDELSLGAIIGISIGSVVVVKYRLDEAIVTFFSHSFVFHFSSLLLLHYV